MQRFLPVRTRTRRFHAPGAGKPLARLGAKLAAAALLSGSMLAAQPAVAGQPVAQASGKAPAAAQHQAAPSSQQKQKSSAKRRRALAHRHTASTPTNAAPAAVSATPSAPPPPNWPAKQKPEPAKIVWDSNGLEIQASNSSLDLILHEVATDIGAKIQGLNQDERVFGTYGPGPAREVLSELLDGSGYNILMIGDQGGGTPREIVLSTSGPGGAQPAGNPRPPVQTEEEAPEPAPNYPPQPPRPVPIRNPFGNGSPQIPPQVLQQQQQEQMEQQREQEQNNQQPKQ